MDNMSPQQQDSVAHENKRRLKSQSYRRQSAPSLVISKALTRSKTLSRESVVVSVVPESCPLVQSLLSGGGGGGERRLLLHTQAQLKTGMQTQDRHLFLFNDIMLIAKAKSPHHFKQKLQLRVCELWTASCMEEVCEGTFNPERSFVMGWPTCNCAAIFSSPEQKEKWLSSLKSCIREQKEQEEPKTLPLRVYGKGINTFAVTKTLPVSNWDSTNEVIRLALQQFGIVGNVKDYQLWVVSRRDNAPYPLIGHEFPFSIQMSHVRQALTQGAGVGRETAAAAAAAMAPPCERQRALQAEQLQVNKQCQFILKPRPADSAQPQLTQDLPQKSFKRRRSLISWAFWRGSAPHLGELSAARGCLFARPLSEVCSQNALPTPLMDMLGFLYHEGSWTRGIFRRPAGARAVRELRDALDAGHTHLPLNRDHAFLIAGLFKDFLRSIPGSLLRSELHEEWMEVLEEDEDDPEVQVQDVQRMMGRLPPEHCLLLRPLLAVLHAVQSHAHHNQMTSFNLSVCIAPSLLWPPGAPCSPEVEGRGTKKVCELVKFMMEHCEQILGEEPSAMFGGPPQRAEVAEGAESEWTSPLTDSSYDSLENELDNDGTPASPRFAGRGGALRLAAGPSSLDSILTFSDPDLLDPEAQRSRGLGGQDGDVSSVELDALSLDGQRRGRGRRRSEPALAYASRLRARVIGSADALTGEAAGEGTGEGPAHASSSSLSSTALSPAPSLASPAPMRSSLDSLDSLLGEQSRGAATAIQRPAPEQGPRAPAAPGEAAGRGGGGGAKACRGLHPNSWLRKDRRLSLTQQENMEDANTGAPSSSFSSSGGAQPKPKASGGHTKSRPAPDPAPPPPHHRSTGSLQVPRSPWFRPAHAAAAASGDAAEPRQSSPSLFCKQLSLSLFRRQRSQPAEEAGPGAARLARRRGSEPGRQAVERVAAAAAPAKSRARLPSDPGLKVSVVDGGGDGGASEPRFCLSPNDTKAVRDYFSSHPRSEPGSGQQVALALVEARRQWLRRCSDPTADIDFDQLLFAEESYV